MGLGGEVWQQEEDIEVEPERSRAVGGVRERSFFKADWSFSPERCSIHWPARTSVVMAPAASKKRVGGEERLKTTPNRLYK